MPYKSAKQKRLMQAVQHSPEFAQKVGIPQSVGRKFAEHKAKGGSIKKAANIIRTYHGGAGELPAAIRPGSRLHTSPDPEVANSYALERSGGDNMFEPAWMMPLDVDVSGYGSGDDLYDAWRHIYPHKAHDEWLDSHPSQAAIADDPSVIQELIRRGVKGIKGAWDFGFNDSQKEVPTVVVIDPKTAKGAYTKKAKGGLAHLAGGGSVKGGLNLFSNLMEYVRSLNIAKPLPAEGWEQMLKAPEYKLEGVKFPIPPEEHQFFGTQDILARLRAEGQPVDKVGMLQQLEANQPKLSEKTLATLTNNAPVYDSPSYVLPGPVVGPSSFDRPKAAYSESLTHYQPRLRDVDPTADPDLPFAQLEDLIDLRRPPEEMANRWRGYVAGEPIPHNPPQPLDVVKIATDADLMRNPIYEPAAHHFNELNANLLSHSRATRRQTVEGLPIRLVEEIQSDWHQQARDKGGYRTGPDANEAKIIQLENELQAARASDDPLAYAHAASIEGQLDQLRAPFDESKPPIAPFRKNYGAVELKKQLGEAIESGDEYLAWTTGEQQRDRYASALKKQVDKIHWNRNRDGTYDIIPRKGSTDVSPQVSVKASDLDGLLGKDIANQLRAGEGYSGTVQGDNLTVGGQGMRQFYDKDLLETAKKVVRQYGGNPETDIHMVKVPGSGTDRNNPRTLEIERELDAMDNDPPDDNSPEMESWLATFEELTNELDKLTRGNPYNEVPAIRLTPQLKATYNKIKEKTGAGFSRYAVPPLALGPMATELLQQDETPWQ